MEWQEQQGSCQTFVLISTGSQTGSGQAGNSLARQPGGSSRAATARQQQSGNSSRAAAKRVPCCPSSVQQYPANFPKCNATLVSAGGPHITVYPHPVAPAAASAVWLELQESVGSQP